MNIVEFLVKKKYLSIAWLFFICILTSLGYWVHAKMQKDHEFQGTFALIPEPGAHILPYLEHTKTVERMENVSVPLAEKPAQELVLPSSEENIQEKPVHLLVNTVKKEEDLVKNISKDIKKVDPAPVKNISKPFLMAPCIEHKRSFNRQNPLPKIIVVITGLGQSLDNTLKAIEQLPSEVTLCFVPYARNINTLMNQSRKFGHENLLLLPMEPESYPRRDPGPYTLLTKVDPLKNLQKLESVLSKGTKFVGVTDFMGSRFITSEKDLSPVFHQLKEKGLIFLESTPSLKANAKNTALKAALPYMKVTRSLDPATSLVSIDDQLKEIEKVALAQGHVILYAFTYPKVVDSLNVWIKTLKEKGFVLAPLTSVYDLSEYQKVENEKV